MQIVRQTPRKIHDDRSLLTVFIANPKGLELTENHLLPEQFEQGGKMGRHGERPSQEPCSKFPGYAQCH